MDIKDLLGDAFRDDMTIEEINAALADKTFVDPNTLPKSVSKEIFDKKASELAKVTKELNELKNSTLTEGDKVKKALEDAETARIEFLKKSTKLDVEKVFVEGGLKSEDYKDIIDDIVSENTEASVALAKNFMTIISSQKTAIEKAVKADLLKGSPKPPAGTGGEEITKEKFADMGYEARLQLSLDNPTLYEQLVGENN